MHLLHLGEFKSRMRFVVVALNCCHTSQSWHMGGSSDSVAPRKITGVEGDEVPMSGNALDAYGTRCLYWADPFGICLCFTECYINSRYNIANL